MFVNVKKGFILFMCTILLVFNISATCIKPLTVKATGAEVVVLGGAAVEGISLLLDLIAAGLVSIGAYELYENDERMQIVIDSYVDTLTDPTTGLFSPDRTWGDSTSYDGTHVRDPNTGEWVLNPDVIPTSDKPIVLTPEEQEHYGVSSNYYENAKDLMWEIWQNKHGSGSGGGNSGGDDSGGSDTGNDKGTLVKIGTGVIASVGAFIASITSGETGNETIDSWVNDTSVPTYKGDTDWSEFSLNGISQSDGGAWSYIIDNISTENVRIAGYIYNDKIYLIYHSLFDTTSTCYVLRVTATQIYNGKSSLITSDSFYCSGGYSFNVPVFSSLDDARYFCLTGDDSVCINKEEPQKLVWADMNTLSNALPSTLSPFATLPEGKAIKATALKDYVDDMTSYKSTASPSDLANPETQTQTATQTAQQAVEKNTVDTKTDTEEKEEEKPIFVPPTTTPIDIDGSEVTRDWRLVFPFCIPFDIIDLFTTLMAEPVAPRFEFPMQFPDYGIDYTFVIDFNDFEVLAKVFRTCETVLFILSLCILTGKVIKW